MLLQQALYSGKLVFARKKSSAEVQNENTSKWLSNGKLKRKFHCQVYNRK